MCIGRLRRRLSIYIERLAINNVKDRSVLHNPIRGEATRVYTVAGKLSPRTNPSTSKVDQMLICIGELDGTRFTTITGRQALMIKMESSKGSRWMAKGACIGVAGC